MRTGMKLVTSMNGEAMGYPVKVHRTMRARDLWDLISFVLLTLQNRVSSLLIMPTK